MPEITVKQKIQNMSIFRDASWYYRELGKCIYEGYVPFETVTGWAAGYGLNRYKSISEYYHKGSIVTRKSINLPISITNYILNNMYAEQPVIEFGDEKDNEFMASVLNDIDNDFYNEEKILQGTKINIGDYVIKPYIKDSVIKLDYLIGTRFVATKINNNKVSEGVFISTKQLLESKVKITFRRLEWHYAENGNRYIKYEIYKSREPKRLGKICNLSMMETVFGERIEQGLEEYLNLDTPTFILSRNPQPNNRDLESGRGLGWFINTLDPIQSADEGFEAKSGDIVYGSIQKLVPEGAMEMDGVKDGDKMTFHKHHNPNQRDIFIYGSDNLESYKPEAYAPELRIEDHVLSINTDIDLTSSNVGITSGTFRFDGKSIVTATQVITEKSDTARTIKEFERTTTIDWQNLFLLIKYLAETQLNKTLKFEREDIKINWKDSIIVDDESKKENLSVMADKGWVPPYYYIAAELGIELDEAKKLYVEAQKLEDEKFGFNDDDEFDENGNPIVRDEDGNIIENEDEDEE